LRHGAAQIRAGARYLDYVHAVLAPRVGACGIICAQRGDRLS
jgi:hypothetical protein